MREAEIHTKELPYAPSETSDRKAKWRNLAGLIGRGIYGLLFTALASLGATVLVNQNLRNEFFEILKNTLGGT